MASQRSDKVKQLKMHKYIIMKLYFIKLKIIKKKKEKKSHE